MQVTWNFRRHWWMFPHQTGPFGSLSAWYRSPIWVWSKTYGAIFGPTTHPSKPTIILLNFGGLGRWVPEARLKHCHLGVPCPAWSSTSATWAAWMACSNMSSSACRSMSGDGQAWWSSTRPNHFSDQPLSHNSTWNLEKWEWKITFLLEIANFQAPC